MSVCNFKLTATQERHLITATSTLKCLSIFLLRLISGMAVPISHWKLMM